MKLLIDTQLLLWSLVGDPKLGKRAAALMDDPDHETWVSVVSIWEIAIKHALNRGRPNDMPISGEQALALSRDAGFTILPIEPEHAIATDTLPRLHGDPFDRMLVAQALTEPMHLMTRDARLKDYGSLMIVV